jgi:hypothetical protein
MTTPQLLEILMYDPPAYIWAITIAGVTAVPLVTSAAIHHGARRAGLGRRSAALIAVTAAVILGAWFTASGVIAGHGGYRTRLGHGVPWLPVAVAGVVVTLLALARIPVVARTLSAPGMTSRLIHPHSFRVAGVVFPVLMALGHLPWLFAIPAGFGDIAIGIAAPRIARGLADGTGRRAAMRFNALGIADLVVAMTLGAVIGYRLISVGPSGAPISQLPLALIPSAEVPLLLALHITSISALRKERRLLQQPTVVPHETARV